jgi:hypothetical protein
MPTKSAIKKLTEAYARRIKPKPEEKPSKPSAK